MAFKDGPLAVHLTKTSDPPEMILSLEMPFMVSEFEAKTVDTVGGAMGESVIETTSVPGVAELVEMFEAPSMTHK